MTDPTLSPHKPPVIKDDNDTTRKMCAEIERLKESLLEASNRLSAFGDVIGAARAIQAMEEPSHIANIRLQEAVTLALKRLDKLNRDDEAGIRLVLANAISPLTDRKGKED